MPSLFATRLGSVIPVTLAILLVTAAGHAQIPCGGYEVTAIIAGPDCGPPGLGAVLPYAINEAGDVAGFFICPVLADHAFLWTASSGLQIIPMPPGTTNSRALGIDGTQIVGYHAGSDQQFGKLAFLYEAETGEFTNLGTLPGGDWSEAHAVANGRIVGFWGNTVKGPSPLAFIWQDGQMIDIHPDFGTPRSEANDITSSRDPQVTGWMGTSPLTDARAFIWQSGEVVELPPIPRGFTSEGCSINDLQDVAGGGRMVDPDTGDIVRRAFARIDGGMMLLGTLPGFPHSGAVGINDARTVVGFSSSYFQRPFVWKAGVLTDLNDLISPELNLTIDVASAINQAGQIAAVADSDDLNATVGVVLTPVEGPPGDLDGDCVVGILDLLALLAGWGPCPPLPDCPADLNNDGTVNVFDLLLLLANWG